jgi:sugar/nucleoside kinase (ribokinase family)
MGFEYTCVGLTILDILGAPIDIIPEGGTTSLIQQIRLAPGGTAAGAAVIGSKLGMKTALVGAVGKDDMADFLKTALKKHKVNTDLMQDRDDLPTAATMLAVNTDGQRPNFHAVGASILLEATETMIEAIINSKYVHWGGVGTLLNMDGEISANILKLAKEKGATVTCDFIAPMDGTLDAVKAVLPYVDYFMPSLDEAMEIAGTKTLEDTGAFFLNHGTGACIFKLGSEGSALFTKTSVKKIPALKTNVLDTTGCGDSYCAGFTAALSKGMSDEEACRFATATASLVATGLGSDAGVIDFKSTETFMDNHSSNLKNSDG